MSRNVLRLDSSKNAIDQIRDHILSGNIPVKLGFKAQGFKCSKNEHLIPNEFKGSKDEAKKPKDNFEQSLPKATPYKNRLDVIKQITKRKQQGD